MPTQSTTIHLPLLDTLQLASPCPARWEDMTGDARKRHCAQCDLDVHNISEMTRDEAEGLLATLAHGRVCAQFYRRRDGTILTRDCPLGIAAARARVLKSAARIAAALGLAVLAASAARASQDKSWGNWGWALRMRNTAPVTWVSWKISSGWNALFPPPPGFGMRLGGAIAGPFGTPPPTLGKYGQFGPHPMEYRR
jgi:hypothetical protein